MTNHEHESERKPEASVDVDRAKADIKEVGANYFAHLKEVLLKPDAYFTDAEHGHKVLGLIDLAALVVLVALASMIQQAGYGRFDFGDVLGGMKQGLALAVPLAAVLFIFPWYAKQQGQSLSIDFMIEKLGAAVALSAVLVLLAIPLDLLDIDLHSWFRGAAMILVYVAVFMMSYLYVAPNRLGVATVSLIGFYFVYRLVGLVL